MKNILCLFILCSSLFSNAQFLVFEDSNLKKALVTTICSDTNNDGVADADVDANDDLEIDTVEAKSVTNIVMYYQNIESIKGIENFKNLSSFAALYSKISTVDLSHNMLTRLQLDYNSVPLSITLENLPRLKTFTFSLSNTYDLKLSNVDSLITLIGSNNFIDSFSILNLPRLENFDLPNNKLKFLEVNGHPTLKSLSIGGNPLESLSLAFLPALEILTINGDNNFTEIDIADLPKVEFITIIYGNLKYLSLRNLPNLKRVESYFTSISDFVYDNLPKLSELQITNALLDTVHISNLQSLRNLRLSENKLILAVVENLPNLDNLDLGYNNLSQVFLNLEKKLFEVNLKSNKNLIFVCTTPINKQIISEAVNKSGSQNVPVVTGCVYNPNDLFNLVRIESKLNLDNADCNDGENLSYTSYSVIGLNSANNDTLVFSKNNIFSFVFPNGNYKFAPSAYDTSLFTFIPDTIEVSLPLTPTDSILSFCVVPKAPKAGLDITIVPLNVAVPGFENNLEVVIENIGNTVVSDTFIFLFDNEFQKLEYSSLLPISVIEGKIKWFVNTIIPGEKRKYKLQVLLNTPTQNPPLNDGDTLIYKASMGAFDGKLVDIVRNSLDPNDKTCLQGDKIYPEMIGKYIDYLIRFENLGTFEARNIVVVDTLDLEKFDVRSLQLISSSHPVTVELTGNVIKFNFINIKLSHLLEFNDGFVAFKIKTKDDLKIGDIIENKADIYFDFNFPVRTNTAKSVISLFSKTKEKNFVFGIYPNPANTELNIKYDGNEILLFEISNLIGQQIKYGRISNDRKIDISDLPLGVYIIGVTDSKGSRSSVKFMKM